MAETVNLRRARKARARATQEDAAAANRVKFGRTKAERAAADADASRIKRDLDGAKLADDGPVCPGSAPQDIRGPGSAMP